MAHEVFVFSYNYPSYLGGYPPMFGPTQQPWFPGYGSLIASPVSAPPPTQAGVSKKVVQSVCQRTRLQKTEQVH